MASRREHAVRFKCGHAGCNDYGNYTCATRAEVADLQRRYHPDRWRCVRHTHPEEVLSAANAVRERVLTVFGEPHGNYWGTDRAASGFIYGPGFKAYASDFPVGTRIKITAEILGQE